MNANQWDAIRQLDENDSPVEIAAAIGELLDEYDRLATRRDELLATIARISQSTPLDSEVAEALEQRGKLLAEIGTLRAEREASIRIGDGWRNSYYKATAELAAARPIVEAAKAWRDSVVNEETTGRTRAIADLIVAIDAARGKL